MLVLNKACAGIDVHKRIIVACCLVIQADGSERKQTRTFAATTSDLLQMLDWFHSWGVTVVAMESTGEYWKPLYNILEGNVEVLLVNAQHVKNVPGRKTDVKDAEWLAQLLQHGLLRASFIPPREQRDLRDLTRERSNLVRERASVVNRLQKVLEQANLKLASVASDVMGVSARAMLEAIIDGERDPQRLAELARGRMRSRRAELAQALEGRVRPHHCFMLTQHLAIIDALDEQIEIFSQEIKAQLELATPVAVTPKSPQVKPDQPVEPSQSGATPQQLSWVEAVSLLDSIPGIDQRVAELILAEVGIDMRRFPSAAHLASWAGVAPSNNRSAGKQLPGRISAGDRPIRKGLVQAAQAAAKSKKSYLGALYARVAAKRGKRRAIIAVAHSMLVSVFYMFQRKEAYVDLGYEYEDKRKRDTTTQRLVRRLKGLGFEVTLTATPAATLTPAGVSVGN